MLSANHGRMRADRRVHDSVEPRSRGMLKSQLDRRHGKRFMNWIPENRRSDSNAPPAMILKESLLIGWLQFTPIASNVRLGSAFPKFESYRS
jgi:hypothetical protein